METLYQENFPNRAENEKFNKVNEQIQKNQENVAKVEQAATDNKENLDTVSAITEVLIALAISQNGGMPTHAYNKVAGFIKPLVKSTRYANGDIVAMPYPLKTMPNGQVEPRPSSSSRCRLMRAIHTKSSHYLICYNKAC